MDQFQCIQLIKSYKQYPVLWNSNEKAYYNKNMREDAWREIGDALQLPVQMLKTKMKSLMGTYRSEKSRQNKSRLMGSGSKDVYQSKWFAFVHFDFLRDKDQPNDTLDTVEIQIKTEEDDDNDEKEESDYEPTLTGNANEVVVKETIETAPKRKVTDVPSTRKRHKKNNDCTKLNEILKKTSPVDSISQDLSECQIFGNLVATKLAKYSWELQSNVEQDIMNVLFKADRIHLNQTFNEIGISEHSTSCRSTPANLQHQLDESDIELQDL